MPRIESGVMATTPDPDHTATRGKYKFTRDPLASRVTVVAQGIGVPLDAFTDTRPLTIVAKEWFTQFGEEDKPHPIADMPLREAYERFGGRP